MEIASFCRGCSAVCGVLATVEGGRITALRGDPDSPVSAGYLCEAGTASIRMPDAPGRITGPARREGSSWVPLTWDEALEEIGGKLSKIRRSAGPTAVGLHAGNAVAASSTDLARTLAFAVAMGTPNTFTSFAQVASPWIHAAELVVGHPVALQADVGRAHYTLLLGGNQTASQWGPFSAGTTQLAGLRRMKSKYKGKLAVADPRKTELAASADVHAQIRPGTDLFYVLGILNAVIAGGWVDRQYIADYTTGFDAMAEAVAPWTAERAAEICGVDRSRIAGVALKLSRAPMAAIHIGRGALLSGHGTLASWAVLALSAVTANLLRPGGLYDSPGLLDLHPVARALSTGEAPRSRVGAIPAVLLQLPSSLLAEEALTPGDGQLKALISLCGDPVRSAPDGRRMRRALDDLDLVVCVDTHHNSTTALADYVLPTVHFWERSDSLAHASAALPVRHAQVTPAVIPGPEDARPVHQVLADLFRATRPPLLGGPFGRHVQLIARFLATSDLPTWERRAWDLLADDVSWEELLANPAGVSRGALSRANWRVSHPEERVDLLPEAIARALARLSDPEGDGLWLGSRSRTEGQPFRSPVDPGEITVDLHPDALAALGVEPGGRVVVEGPGGSVLGVAVADPELREDTVILPGGWGPGADLGAPGDGPGNVVGTGVDSLTGAPAWSGTRVKVRAA